MSLRDPIVWDNVFNGHHAAYLGRWPMASGTGPDGDYANVGAIRADYAGQSFPWLVGFVVGLRVRLDGAARAFSRLAFGRTISAPMQVRAAIYLAPPPPVADGVLRHSTPSAALEWTDLFAGKSSSLPFHAAASEADGGEPAAAPALALTPVSAAILDLTDGVADIPCPVTVREAATLVVAVAPYYPRGYAHVRWPLEGWTLS